MICSKHDMQSRFPEQLSQTIYIKVAKEIITRKHILQLKASETWKRVSESWCERSTTSSFSAVIWQSRKNKTRGWASG